MPAVSKKQQRYFGYLLSNPEERKKKGISKKAAKDFAQDIQEVSPPGWGHTKAEKEKTKPWKPKSKIGGTAAAFKRALDDGRFKGLPGDKTKKEKTASMFKLMWSMKKKGDKPHYKPGTDKKYKKYQDESFEIDTSAHKKAQKKAKLRNLAKGNTNPNEKAAAEKKAGGPKLYGESISTKDTKKLNKASALDQSKDPKDWDSARARRTEIDYKDLMRQIKAKKKMRSEEASYKQRDKALKKSKKAMDFRHRTIHKGGDDDINEATTMRDNNLFGNAYAGSYETLKKKIGSKKKHNKPAFKEGISFKDFRIESSAAWQRKEGKNKEGGLTEKGRKSYERENPGSDLKAPQPEGGSRKKSFCARMGGMKKKLTSKKTANDPDSRINKALRKWKC